MPMKNPSHPGELIRDICIDGLKLNISEGATALGVSRSTLSRLVNGKANVSPEMAVRLSKAFAAQPVFGFACSLILPFDTAAISAKQIKELRKDDQGRFLREISCTPILHLSNTRHLNSLSLSGTR